MVFGPALGGVLIAWVGAPGVLLVDGATYLFAFAVVLVLVRGGRPVAPDEDARGVLAGVRYLARDRVLGPITLSVIVLDCASGALAVAIPLLAYTRYDRDPHVGGWIFTAFGLGAVAGSVLVVKLLDRFRPLRLASVAIVLATVPLWALAAPVAWPVACAALLVCGVFVPMVNAPALGLITTRPPAALRAKVMTAVMSASALGGPVGRLAVGPLYTRVGTSGVWIAIAAGLSVGALLFAAAALHGDRRTDAAVAPAVV
jgi:predicted MFS family arabinose efflux permease